jgi:hypothetical protein
MKKVGDIVKYNEVLWVKIAEIIGNSAIVSPIHKEDIEKKRMEEKELVPLISLRTIEEIQK